MYLTITYRTILFLSVFILPSQFLHGQSLSFSSDKLSVISEDYVGSKSNWPLITNLASYDPSSNTFTLTKSQLDQLKKVKFIQKKVEKAKESYNYYIKRGAMVFARESSLAFDSTLYTYQNVINQGDLNAVLALSSDIDKKLEKVKTDTENNRVEQVSALLSDKTGEVYRRQGLLGDWLSAALLEQYKKQDGVKTESKTYATLDFVDGSNVLVSPNTIAIIRDVSLDKLTNGAETEIVINRGGLLASLSAEARQQSKFTLLAGNSETVVKSSRFWAFNNEEEDVVTYSNYEGEATVKAENSTVKLGKNEGTIVVRGQEPSLPVRLLPSPKLPWAAFDTVIFTTEFLAQWNPMINAVYYELDLSDNSSFTGNLKTYRSNNNTVIIENLKLGTNLIRLRAYDKNGLRGIDSPVYRILRNKDNQPPAIFIGNGNNQTWYTDQKDYTVFGKTETGVSLEINKKTLTVSQDGSFSHQINIDSEVTSLVIKASDESGNVTIVNKQLIRMTDERLLNLTWSVPVLEGKIKRASTLSVRGIAYNPITVQITVGINKYEANSGINGNWALTFPVGKEDELRISFINSQTGKMILTKTVSIGN